MMKRLCLVLTLCLVTALLGACQGVGVPKVTTEAPTVDKDPTDRTQTVELTMAEIVHANSTTRLRELYDSFRITYAYSDGYTFDYYIDADSVVEMDDTYCAIFTETEGMYCDSGYYARILYAGIEPDMEWSRWLALNEYTTLWETVERAVLRDGKIYVDTSFSVEYISDVFGEDSGLSGVLTEYVLDAETYVVLEATTTYRYIDGFCDTVERRLRTDATRPYEAESLLSYMNNSQSTRTFTIILDPNTPAETAYTVTLPQDAYVEFYYPDNYGDLYLDRDCTQPATLEDMDTTEDLTVYARALDGEAETEGTL